MSADTSNARAPRRTKDARTPRPNTRYGREQLPSRTGQNAAAAPRRRVHGGRAAAPRQVSDTPTDEESVRPEPSPDPNAGDVQELDRLRDRFNRPSGGQWAIFHDPFQRRWFAVRGKDGWVVARTAAELEKRIDRA